MSTKSDDLMRRADRGGRVAAIREALGKTGDQFAVDLARVAKSFGLKVRYDKAKVSRIESGTRKMTVEEVAFLLVLDPQGRDVAWLVFGDESRAISRDKFRRAL